MSAIRRTWTLVAVLVALIGADVLARRVDHGPDALPTIAAFADDEPTALTITWGDVSTRIVRDEGWAIVAPIDHPADVELVDGTLALLGRGVTPDARVDDGDHERYGLDGGDPVLVEIEGAAGALARFYVGHDAGDGSTFVRLPDQDVVYRARIGGRARYARAPGAWRDHQLLRVEADRIVAIGVGAHRFVRELAVDASPGPWSLAGDPSFPADDVLLDALADALARLRAAEILSADFPAGLDRPVAIDVQLDDGTLTQLEIGRTAQGGFARTEPGGPVYRIAPQLAELLASGLDTWRDRTLLVVDRPTAITLEDDAGTAVVERDPRTDVWALTRPANVDADPRRIAQIADYVAKLRVEDFVAAPATFRVTARLRITDASGATREVEIGGLVPDRAAGQEQVYVRLADDPDRVGVLAARTWSTLRQAWAR